MPSFFWRAARDRAVAGQPLLRYRTASPLPVRRSNRIPSHLRRRSRQLLRSRPRRAAKAVSGPCAFALRYRPDIGAYLAARCRNTPYLHDLDDAVQEVFVACSPDGRPSAAFSPDGRSLVVGEGEVISLWDVSTGRLQGSSADCP